MYPTFMMVKTHCVFKALDNIAKFFRFLYNLEQ